MVIETASPGIVINGLILPVGLVMLSLQTLLFRRSFR